MFSLKSPLSAIRRCSDKTLAMAGMYGLFLLAPMAFGILSLALGKDMNWDLRNYHYYNGYALLAWRYDVDVAPAQLQTWLNPTLDVPWYLMMTYLSSSTVGFVTGAVQGLNFPFAYLIAWRLVQHQRAAIRGFIALACAFFGCLAPTFLMELGSTNHDTTLSVPILAATFLLLGVVADPSSTRTRTVAVAGALLGAAAALKLTNAVYALGATLALYMSAEMSIVHVRRVLIFCISGAVTGIVLLGPWMWFLWETFGNPLFPVYNNFFQSPWVSAHKFAFQGFLPDAAWEYAVWPLIFSIDPNRVGEWKFEDYRFALLWIVGLLYVVGAINRAPWASIPRQHQVDTSASRAPENFLFYFTLFSFILWMYMYSAYRYLAPLELIAPLVFGLALSRMQFSRKTLAIVLTCFGFVSILVLDIPNRERFGWDEKYIDVSVGDLKNPDETLILMVGSGLGAPMAYVIPEFPEGVRFLRPDGNLGLKKHHLMMKHMIRAVGRHEGPIYLLFAAAREDKALRSAFTKFGLTASPGSCAKLETNVGDHLVMCEAKSFGND